MVFSSEVEETIDGVVELYECDLGQLSSMVDELCELFPDIDRDDFQKEIEKRFTVSNADVPAASPHKLIPKDDLNDALLMGVADIDSTIDYLHELHPDLTHEEIETQLTSAVAAPQSSMVFSSEVQDTIDGVIELYESDLGQLSSMVDELSGLFPDMDRNDFRKLIEKRLNLSNANVPLPPVPTQKRIREDGLSDVFSSEVQDTIDGVIVVYGSDLGQLSSMVDELCKIFPYVDSNDFEEEIVKRFTVSDSSVPAALPHKSIPKDDLNDALLMGEGDIDSMIDYLHELHPHLTNEEIGTQLTSAMGASQSSDGGITTWTPTKTPPRRGPTYQPSDFSPSLFGACSSKTMKLLKDKRTKYLPDYASPKRTPLQTREDPTSSQTKRYREDSTPSPRKRFREDSQQPTETVNASRKRLLSSGSPDSGERRESKPKRRGSS